MLALLCVAALLVSASASPAPGSCSTLNPCLQGAVCTDTANGPTCSCPGGYSGNGLTSPCVDLNECALGTDNCIGTANCVNTEGSFYCACLFGETINSDMDCVSVTTTISGVVFASNNRSRVYTGISVQLYRTRKSERADLIQQTVTNNNGQYFFDVAFGRRYMTCATVNGFEACVIHTVPAQNVLTASVDQEIVLIEGSQTGTARRRRLTNLSSLNIPVPDPLAPNQWEIQTVWAMDHALYQCDWDATVSSDIEGGCLAAMKDPYNNGACQTGTGSGARSVYVYQDSSCNYDSYGFEAIRITEPGIKTYKHMVYGYGMNSSFSLSADSQAQILIYRRGPSSNVLHASLLLSQAIPGNFKHRFWHTFSLAINTPANQYVGTGTVTFTNLVSCNPQETTGSTAALNFENGPRNC